MKTTMILLLTGALAVASPALAKRRVGFPRPCTKVNILLLSDKNYACPNDSVHLSWQATDYSGVSLQGVAENLPSSGSLDVVVTEQRTFTATAKSSCGQGAYSTLTVAMKAGSQGTLEVPDAMTAGDHSPLLITASNSSNWSLSSTLSNPFSPTSGASDGAFSPDYYAMNAGTDSVMLTIHGPCSQPTIITRPILIHASYIPPPAPVPYPVPPTPYPTPTPVPYPQPAPQPVPPPSGTILCCDGTHSPTCTYPHSGCCSGHGGFNCH